MIEILEGVGGWGQLYYKILANNDTGAAPGNQAGIVIPKPLRAVFPALPTASAQNPATDCRIVVELSLNGIFLGCVETRYQQQTWGGKRSPETRVTENLSKLRNAVKGEDILLIQKRLDSGLYRLAAITQDTAEYAVFTNMIAGNTQRWGTVGFIPLENIFDHAIRKTQRSILSIVRSDTFKKNVMAAYDFRCAVTGEAIQSPCGHYELEAAHIIPLSLRGADEARNGLLLSRRLHWALDNSLVYFDESRKLVVQNSVRNISENSPLTRLHGTVLRESSQRKFRASDDALEWQRNYAISNLNPTPL